MIAAIYAMGMRARRWPKSIAVYTDTDEYLGKIADGQVADWDDAAAKERLEAVVARAREAGL